MVADSLFEFKKIAQSNPVGKDVSFSPLTDCLMPATPPLSGAPDDSGTVPAAATRPMHTFEETNIDPADCGRPDFLFLSPSHA